MSNVNCVYYAVAKNPDNPLVIIRELNNAIPRNCRVLSAILKDNTVIFIFRNHAFKNGDFVDIISNDVTFFVDESDFKKFMQDYFNDVHMECPNLEKIRNWSDR